MRRGHAPRPSKNPKEQRMITWRLKGDLFNKLMKVTEELNISHNRFITQVVSKAVYELEHKLEQEKKP